MTEPLFVVRSADSRAPYRADCITVSTGPCPVTASLYRPEHIHILFYFVLFYFVYLVTLIIHSIHVDLFIYIFLCMLCVMSLKLL